MPPAGVDLAVIYDSCVLHPPYLRDLLMHLARTGLFRAHWTDDIHEEWIGSVLGLPAAPPRAQLERTRALMEAAVPGALVSGYQPLIDALVLPDPDDRHVLAAAVHIGAEAIITYNVRDFPTERLGPYGVRPEHPDAFVSALLTAYPADVCEAIRIQRSMMLRPALTAEDLRDRFRRLALVQTANLLASATDRI